MEGRFSAVELIGITPNKISMPMTIRPNPTTMYPFLVEPKFFSARGMFQKASPR
jgi:hypothetical protein